METPIVFFSSRSENVLRFINELHMPSLRIPLSQHASMPLMASPYVLFTPSYGAGGEHGAVPMPVKAFLKANRERLHLCRGVIVSGNTTFGSGYGSAGQVLQRRLNLPTLYKFEVFGNRDDVEQVNSIMKTLFPAVPHSVDFQQPSYFRRESLPV